MINRLKYLTNTSLALKYIKERKIAELDFLIDMNEGDLFVSTDFLYARKTKPTAKQVRRLFRNRYYYKKKVKYIIQPDTVLVLLKKHKIYKEWYFCLDSIGNRNIWVDISKNYTFLTAIKK